MAYFSTLMYALKIEVLSLIKNKQKKKYEFTLNHQGKHKLIEIYVKLPVGKYNDDVQ